MESVSAGATYICFMLYTFSSCIGSLLISFIFNSWLQLDQTMHVHLFFILMDVILVPGLGFTYLGLYLMNGNGQPALLYLVPCTLGNVKEFFIFWPIEFQMFYFVFYSFLLILLWSSGVTVFLGLIRRELKQLWDYGTEPEVSRSTIEPAVEGTRSV